MSFVELDSLTKTYKGQSHSVVDDVSLSIREGEIFALLGRSGCGKTTLLKMIAGLEAQDGGTVKIDGTDMDGVRAEKRPCSMVFQKALLFRNMSVAQNIGFAPRVNRTMPKDEIAAKTDEMLELIEMQGMGAKKATELSGGQEQRVSLARALMTDPKVLLLDEPLSALDARLRASLRKEIKRLNRTLGTTMVLVTHDQEEAVEVADRIALMGEGRILQCGAPEEFYTRPASREVAEFFGWRNFIPAECIAGSAVCAFGSFPAHGCENLATGPAILAIRPEAACSIGEGDLQGTVVERDLHGAFAYCTVDIDGERLVLYLRASQMPEVGQQISFSLDEQLMCALSAHD